MSDQQPNPKSRPIYYDILKSIDDFFQNTYANLEHHPLFSQPIPVHTFWKDGLWIAEAKLPGIDKNQIQLDIQREAIRIQVKMDEQSYMNDDNTGKSHYHQKLQVQQRLIPVPFLFNEKDVRATYKNGLLGITIPNKRKQIPID